MNNEQFRRMLASNSSSNSGDKSGTPRNAPSGGATPGGLLGSRMRSNIPMTPRSVTGVDFARQLAEKRREDDDRPTKRFKASAAPKGTKLPEGYQDRAQLRNKEVANEDPEDLQQRVKALEEMVKLGQIDQRTFDKLCAELGVGGDVGSTHMVKGLDWKLLNRVKAGEDVSKAAEKPAPAPEEEPLSAEMAEEEFERLMEEKGLEQVAAAPKEQKEKKKGVMAPPPPRKKTRDEILKELKASRAAPPPPPESTLGSRFKKVGDDKPEKKRFVELAENGRRREVLVITDAQGNTKRKVRWIDKPGEKAPPSELVQLDKNAKPLGMEVPAGIAAKAAVSAAPEDDDDDIFAGVGADYDPLAGIEQEDDSSSDDEEGEVKKKSTADGEKKDSAKEETGPEAATKPVKRNYFSSSASAVAEEEPEDRSNPLTKDPTILAALKRAAALRQASPSAEDSGESGEAALRHKNFLEEARRRDALDAADMDMGFGGSRIEDGEEDDGPLLDFDDDGEGQQRGGAKKRKRGPKKKKGDKDSVSDVMSVLEGRKKD